MQRYHVAAYIWPSFHHEPRLAHIWPDGDGEWHTVRRAEPRFPGHDQPRIPLLGYQDEADPAVMREQLALAERHGVDTFIMDWYWYDDQPCFERHLNEGLIPALEGREQRFYLMWANHDANATWDPTSDSQELWWPGAVDRATFERVSERLIERYFTLPSYFRIDGCPVFCIYLLPTLIEGLGGIAAAREALDWMRDRARAAGLPGLHLQAIQMRGVPQDVAERVPDIQGLSVDEMIERLGFDSVTYYQFVHAAGATGDYPSWAAKAMAHWDECAERYPMFFPHVSIGWDNNPRWPTEKGLVSGSTPAAFEACLWKAKRFIDEHPEQPPLVTINSWNEWTEASYLLPDMRHAYGYLEAVRKVFGS